MDTYHERSPQTDGQTACGRKQKTMTPSFVVESCPKRPCAITLPDPMASRYLFNFGQVQMKLQEVSKVTASAGAFAALLKRLGYARAAFRQSSHLLARRKHVRPMKLPDTDSLEHNKDRLNMKSNSHPLTSIQLWTNLQDVTSTSYIPHCLGKFTQYI